MSYTNPNPSSIPVSDPRYPVWGRIWLCRVPRIAHYDTKYLETYGMHTSGSVKIDRALAMQQTEVYITINQMVEHYHQNTMVSIIKQKDVKAIYEICQDYTFDWADSLHGGVLNYNIPFEDLIKIDEFAEAVYQYAGHEYGAEFARSFIPKEMMGGAIDMNAMFAAVDKRRKERGKHKVDPYTVRNIYSPPLKNGDVVVKEEEVRKELPPRPSPRELFMSYMDRSGYAGRMS